MADPGPACDLVDRHVRAELGKGVRSRLEDAVEVAACVGPQNGHYAPTTTGSPEAACSSILATWRLRRSATITPRATIIATAPAANAQWKPTTRLCAGEPTADGRPARRERRQDGEAERAADLLRRVEQARRETLVGVLETGRRDQRERHEDRAHPERRQDDRRQHVRQVRAVHRQLREQQRDRQRSAGSRPRRPAGHRPAARTADASPAETMIPAENGRSATPAFSGPKPSTRWM